MAEALTPLVLAAAFVLAGAGAMKLRDPEGVCAALRVLGLPGGRFSARALGLAEIAVGAWVALAPTRVGCAVLTGVYAGFGIAALVLARRHAACGCFGAGDAPATRFQSLLSAALASVAALALVAPPGGLRWILQRPPGVGFALLLGAAGVAYAVVIAYTLLPRAWSAWSAS